MTRPGYNDFARLAKKDRVIAVTSEIPSDRITPVDAFYAVGASYLLESAEQGLTVGRYSFLGIEPLLSMHIEGQRCIIRENQTEKVFERKDPLKKVLEILKSRPFYGFGQLSPFPGGAVGYVGYDYVAHWENIHSEGSKTESSLPDALFMITRYNLIFDHLMHTLKIVCNVHISGDPRSEYNDAVKGINRIISQLEQKQTISGTLRIGPIKSAYSKKKFCKDVETVKSLISEGEAIQVVLSQQLYADYEGDPFRIFRKLRSINPSPYMFYIDFGDIILLGASPEVMVKAENGKVVLRPIAGTRPRGSSAEEDEALKKELLNDEKERAEHIMLVDLARNDLGRIAKAGSVQVERFMEIEMYSHVMHIVSEVSARIKEGVDIIDILRATFPAGTVSGAPKVRAMQIIDRLEPAVRGPYGGLIGYMSYTGGFDSCITIRTMVLSENRLHIQAGAGIVFDSIPENEYQETLNKAGALLSAIDKEGTAL